MRAGSDFANNWFDSRQYPTTESRDAIITAVDIANNKVTVRIQGSRQDITVDYPANISSSPSYIKVGNAVRLTYKGGQRLSMGISGHGLALPTLVGTIAGPSTPQDIILSGLYLQSIPNSPCMEVMIQTGSVRFGGQAVIIDALPMGDSFYIMGMGGQLAMVAAVMDCSSPSVSGFRYDVITLDPTLGFERVVGVTDPSTPEMPGTDALIVGTILYCPNQTEIMQSNINALFSAPAPRLMVATLGIGVMSWGYTQTYVNIAITDQYGNPALQAGGWPIQAQIIQGNGYLGLSTLASTAETLLGYTLSNSCGMRFWYTRGDSLSDVSPTIQFLLQINVALQANVTIVLLDHNGNPMM